MKRQNAHDGSEGLPSKWSKILVAYSGYKAVLGFSVQGLGPQQSTVLLQWFASCLPRTDNSCGCLLSDAEEHPVCKACKPASCQLNDAGFLYSIRDSQSMRRCQPNEVQDHRAWTKVGATSRAMHRTACCPRPPTGMSIPDCCNSASIACAGTLRTCRSCERVVKKTASPDQKASAGNRFPQIAKPWYTWAFCKHLEQPYSQVSAHSDNKPREMQPRKAYCVCI